MGNRYEPAEFGHASEQYFQRTGQKGVQLAHPIGFDLSFIKIFKGLGFIKNGYQLDLLFRTQFNGRQAGHFLAVV